jgi:hypothetical protein
LQEGQRRLADASGRHKRGNEAGTELVSEKPLAGRDRAWIVASAPFVELRGGPADPWRAPISRFELAKNGFNLVAKASSILCGDAVRVRLENCGCAIDRKSEM